VILAVAISAGHGLTQRFSVLTSEDARKQRIERSPTALPTLHLTGADGQITTLQNFSANSKKVVLVDFFFTRCESICSVLATQFQSLQSEIIRRGLENKVMLLSISFDDVHDTPAALNAYAQRVNANPSIWRFAKASSPLDLSNALGAFDVTVIPDALAIYQHNAAVHVVDPQTRLVRIIDYDAAATALDWALNFYITGAAQASVPASLPVMTP
jgi:protein SCO1